VKLLRMVIENFLSFGKAVFYFDEVGLCLVEGENMDDESARSNGSGKSAMIDALVWCLFGTTLRGYENDEVVNRKVGEDCVVTVYFVPDDVSVQYEVRRARRHSKFKNTLIIEETNRGGESSDLSGSSNSETQEIIEKILGCSKRTFLSSVVFGQDRAYRFSSLTDKEQKEILDEVLGVERFAQACAAARVKVNEIEASVIQAQRDFDKAEEARDAARDDMEEMKEKGESFEDERKEKIKAEREKLTKAKEWVKKNAKLDGDKLKAAAEKTKKAEATAEKTLAGLDKVRDEAFELRAVAQAKVSELKSQVKKHEGLKGDCPTCGQRIDDLQHERVLTDLKKKFAAASKTLERAQTVVDKMEEQVTEAQNEAVAARRAAFAAQKDLAEVAASEANAKAWKQRVSDHEKRVAELEKEESPYAALTKKAEARYIKHDAEVKLLNERIAAEEARLKTAKFWVTAFGAKGLRSLLLDTSLPILNDEAARLSEAVTGGSIAISFSATSELKSGKTVDRFEVKVDNKHGAGTYQGNSAGERAKVDLCVGLALQRLVASRSSSSFNVVFFDEVFDHLDGAAHERVVDVLSEIEKDSIFVVSHDEDLKAWFPSSLRIVKQDGFSTVEA
jgi:DNA repair exonuclease SbcCD ATPase subunit